MKKIGIVGAGIAGLICAYRLLQKGAKVIVFEKEITVGGRIPYCGAVSTEKFQPKLIALTKELNLESLAVSLLLKEQGFFTKEGEIIRGDALLKFFFKALGARGMFSFVKLTRFVNQLNFDPKNPDPKLTPLRNISFVDYLNKYPEKVRKFVADFSKLFIFEDDLQKVSAEYGLCHLRWGNELSTNKAFGFEENNLMTLTNVLYKKIIDMGGQVLTSVKVTSVKKEGEQFKVIYGKEFYEEEGEKEERVEEIVFATPLDITQEIFPELNFENTGIFYKGTKCFFVEGKNRQSELKFIVGLQGNPANLRALFNIFTPNLVYPIDEEKPIDLEKFYTEYKIIQEKELMPAFPIHSPNVQLPQLKTDIPGVYICGDFYHYPTIESAIVSAEEVANLCVS